MTDDTAHAAQLVAALQRANPANAPAERIAALREIARLATAWADALEADA